ncbi:4994_t:CDS:2 [Cetraspora pellucida]|uniref:4994_t:CDS:1 n=1 Tax=Cetraspora pellucida TaxID=1433469 RepID=A0A9N9I5U4_9GLOM|nr:4994_t:CDS:2 [Cetraspora pellucida]
MAKIENGNNSSLYSFPTNIQENLSSPDWWKKLQELHNLVEPYCAALNKLQTNGAQLYKSDKVLKLCQLRDKLQHNRLNEALTKQEKKICKTNIAMQAQNTNLEISDNESVDLLSKEDIYIEDSYTKETNIENTNVEDTHFENSHIEDTYVENTYIEDIYVEELNKTNSDSFEDFCIMHSAEDYEDFCIMHSAEDYEDFGTTHPAEDHKAK